MDSTGKELSSQIRPIPRQIAEGEAYYQSVSNDPYDTDYNNRSLKDYVQFLMKYRWLVLAVASVCVVLTALYSFLATPVYTATSVIKINTYAPLLPGAGVEASLMQQTREADYLNTQVEVLSGLSLANQVMSDSEISPHIEEYFSRQGGMFSIFSAVLGFFSTSSPTPSGSESTNSAYNFSVNDLKRYKSLVSIAPVRKTSLVRVSATTTDPSLSAKIANAHSKHFIQLTRNERQKSTLESLVFLKAQARELADKVALTERELATYAEENAIVSLNKDENIVVKQLSELNQMLTEAKATRIKSETAFKEAESGSGVDSTAFDDESIQRQRVSLKEAEAEYALLSEKFKPSFPKMVQLKARINTLKSNLKSERGQVVKGLEAKYKADLETERELSEQVDIQKSKAFELSRREVQYNIMRREYESLKDLHQAVLRQLKEAQLSSESSGTNVSIGDAAAVPESPSSPRKFRNILIAMLMGPLIGLAIALLFESLDNTIKTPEEVEQLLSVPSLGVVPMFSLEAEANGLKLLTTGSAENPPPPIEDTDTTQQEDSSGLPSVKMDQSLSDKVELVTMKAPRSIASESFKTIRTSILLSSADNPPKLILVTSGQKSEGKTTLITNLAVTLSQSGHRTLLIDADLRRPALHRQFGIDQMEAGLVDCLTGLKDLEDVIFDSQIPNLELITAGSIPPNPSELLGSTKMAELLHGLKEHYDYVLVDAPPVLPVTDAVVLSRTVDGVVLVVRGQETQQQVARNAVGRLRQVGANVLGCVLNDVDIRSGDYYYYRRGYYAYYREDEPQKKSRLGRMVS